MNATRFAPSPTGRMHIGNIRALVMSYLWAQKNKAKFILRIDNTDKERSKPELIEAIYQDLAWFGMKYDETFKQSDMLNNYNDALQKCLELGIVYPVYDTKDEVDLIRRALSIKKLPPAYKRHNAKFIPDRPCYYRFDIGQETISFQDEIKGEILINLGSISDPVITKPDGEFTYIFASVIDDLREDVSMVIRGGDHVTNTATQIAMIKKMSPIFGQKEVKFAHYPIFSEAGAKMSKRNQAISIDAIKQSFHPLTILHYAWHLGNNAPISVFKNINDLAEAFDLHTYSSSSLIEFVEEDLWKWQHRVFSNIDYDASWQSMRAPQAWPMIREVVQSREDILSWDRIFCDKIAFTTSIGQIEGLKVDNLIEQVAQSLGNKKTAMIFLRQILTGMTNGPKVVDLLKMIPQDVLKYRLEHYKYVPIMVYNTQNKAKAVFTPINPANVRIYACGPTIYKSPHIGNARSFVVFDTLRRLMSNFYHTTYVQNITDVDDKIVIACHDNNLSFAELTEPIYATFKRNMKDLNVLEPTMEPKVTKYIPKIIDAIQKIIDAGHAYIAEDGVNFKIASIANYDIFNCCAESKTDFALWKFKEGLGWDSPWGHGRPGWHIECTVMSQDTIGLPFDIHLGGRDLIFPHHTNECAQATALGHSTTANYWMHSNFINVDDCKMSKSLNNFIEIDKIDIHPMIVRTALLLSHYRDPMNWCENVLDNARNLYNKWRRMLGEREKSAGGMPLNGVLHALMDDLNTPLAITKLNEALHTESTSNLLASFNLLGITFDFSYLQDEKIISLMQKRQNAREMRDFKTADAIKQELISLGVEVFDLPNESKWYTWVN